MRRGRRDVNICWAREASKTAHHEWPLCVLGSFLRDQSRIEGGDITFQRPHLSLSPQLLFAGEELLEKLPALSVVQRWIPAGTLSLSLSPPLAPALPPLGREVPSSKAWRQGSVWKATTAEHPHLQIFLQFSSKNYRVWLLKQVQTAAGAASVIDSDNSLLALIKIHKSPIPRSY